MRDLLNMEVSAEELQGNVRVIIYNSVGARVLSQELNVQGRVSIPVGHLVAGNYFVHLANDKYVVGKAMVIVK